MPFSQKQQEYFNNATRRWNVKQGATRSGKTYMDYFVIPKRIRRLKGKEGLVVLLGNTKGTLQRNIIEPLQAIWGTGLVGDIKTDNTAILFGEKCFCLGADKITQVNRLRGSSVKYCYGDEVVTWHKDVFDMLKSRLDKPYSCFDGTCNPDNPFHWFKKFLDSDADIYSQQYGIDDNPYLDNTFVENLKKEYLGTVYYDRFILGKWAIAQGLIYPMFNKETHVCKPEDRPYTQYHISCDYGTLNPMAMGLWGLCGGIWYRVKEYYHSGKATGIQKTDEEYYTALCELAGDRHIRSVLVDPSAASFIACIKSHNRFRTEKANNDVLNGIQNVATRLQGGTIRINSCCEDFIKEIQVYSWDEKAAEDRPIKEHDHCLTGDTLVNTPTGDFRIDELMGRTGEVYCYNEQDNCKTVSTFRDVRMTQENADIYEITLADGKTVKATGEHPFLTREGWKTLNALSLEDEILEVESCLQQTNTAERKSDIAGGCYVGITSIKLTGKANVYNMEVDTHHNFSVNGGVIVHNCMDDFRYFVNTVLESKNTVRLHNFNI